MIVLAGSKIPDNFIATASRYFPNAKFVSTYGMTEIGAISHYIPSVHVATNSGILAAGAIAKIVDEIGYCCGPYSRGEIRIKRKSEFLGYLDDPDATAAAFDDKGFFRTVDCGYFDENGILFFEDRIKNLIRVYYFRVPILPFEIEEFLLKMPGVNEVCVVGIPVAIGAGLPAAVIVRQPNSQLCEKDVFDVVAGRKFI